MKQPFDFTGAAPRLTGTLEKLAADNGIPCKVQGLRATAAQK